MAKLHIEAVFGEPVKVLYYLYDQKDSAISKRMLKYNVLSNYNRLNAILDSLIATNLASIEVLVDKTSRAHSVKITAKGIKFVEELRRIELELSE